MFDKFIPSGINKFRNRSKIRSAKNLGVIQVEHNPGANRYRDEKLEILDSYYENRQYNHLPEWDKSQNEAGHHIPIRQRRPRIRVAFAKAMMGRVTAKLIGGAQFPTIKLPDSPDDQEFIKAVVREARLKSRLLEPMRRLLNTGSVFVRYWLVEGVIKFEFFDSKFCYPIFTPGGDLLTITIKYIFTDKSEKDHSGNYKRKWFKMTLDQNGETLFDNPDFDEHAKEDPEFQVVEQIEHGFGFVQGEWFQTCELKDSIDGYGITSDLTDFIDELCYSISQSSHAVSYNQDPQLTLNGMDEEELDVLVRSAARSWNLGREGEAKFLESNLTGVERASELRDKIRLNIQDISRIVLLDPEKIVGSAQSGKAMEILHGPLVELVEELQGMIEPGFKNLVLKICLSVLLSAKRGIDVPIDLPAGYAPETLDFLLKWHPLFQETIQDLQGKVTLASSAATANLISRETGTRFLAEDFGIEDVEEELAKIAAQPVLNPFGGF